MAIVPVYAQCLGISIASSTTVYLPIGDTGSNGFPTTSATGSSTYFTLGTFTALALYIVTNSATVTACTVYLSIAGIAGNLSISVVAGATGEFSDTSHTDTLT